MKIQFSKIQKEVFARRPVLKEIADKFSNYSLRDYSKNYWQIPPASPDKIFLSVLKSELEAIYGKDLARAAVLQLTKKALVSTIDHHGIWGHPIFVNADLIYSLHFEANDLPLVLATESVSLNNTSSWSGSLLWHGGSGNLERHSFFSDRLKTLPVFSAPAISRKDISRFHKTTSDKLQNLIDILGLESSVSSQNFSTQACQASHKFWQTVFPAAPKLIYLPLETIISKYLLKVFKDPKDILSQIILTAEGQGLWKKYFADEHTFMFWGVNKKGRREAIKILPENLPELIQNRKIYPSSPLCFAVLLKAGLACAGGFTQTTWLTNVKEKIVKLLSEFSSDNHQPAQAIGLIPTKNFAESSLAWLNIDGRYITPTAVDLYSTGKDYYPEYSKLADSLTLGQSLDLAMPTIYSVVVPLAEQGKFNAGEYQQKVFEDLSMENPNLF